MFNMLQSIPPDSRQLLDVLNQRTGSFLDLVEAVIEYNKMIAEYTSETVASNVTGYRLVGALIELPKWGSAIPAPAVTPKPTEQAAPHSLRLSGVPHRDRSRPTFAPQQLPLPQNPATFPTIEQPIVQTSYMEKQ
jgi:hypothetical protein